MTEFVKLAQLEEELVKRELSASTSACSVDGSLTVSGKRQV